MQKRFRIFTAAFLIFFVLLESANAVNAGSIAEDAASSIQEESNVSNATTVKSNVQLLIDQSGSMNLTDGGRNAIAAAKLFVTELESSEASEISAYTDLGVMSFALETKKVADFSSMKDPKSREYMVNMIDGIKYLPQGSGGTDLGQAVYDAANGLKAYAKEGEKNLIVLFTDGWTQNVKDLVLSNEKMKEGFEIAKSLGAEIYVVGWNEGGNTIPEVGIKEIEYIANSTQTGEGVWSTMEDDSLGSKSGCNYVLTDSWADVNTFYTFVYASMTGSDVSKINGRFTVDAPEIAEVKVIINAKEPVESLNILNPNGDALEVGGTYSVAPSNENRDWVASILDPIQGEYIVQAATDDPEAMRQMVVKKMAVEIKTTASVEALAEASDAQFAGKVKVVPVYKEELYLNDEFLDSVTDCHITVNGGDKKYDLTRQADGFVGYFPISFAGIYEVEACLATPTMSRTAVVTVNAESLPIRQTEDGIYVDLKEIVVKRGKEHKIYLKDEFPALDLKLRVIGLTDEGINIAEIMLAEDEAIVVTGKKEGQAEIQGRAEDGQGNGWTLGGNLVVESGFFWYEILFIALAILIVIILVSLFLRSRQRANGTFEIEISNEFQEQKNTLASHPSGTSFNFWKLVEREMSAIQKAGKDQLQQDLLRNRREIQKYKVLLKKNKGKDGVAKGYAIGKIVLTSDKREVFRSGKLVIRLGFKGYDRNSSGGWEQASGNQRGKTGKRTSQASVLKNNW